MHRPIGRLPVDQRQVVVADLGAEQLAVPGELRGDVGQGHGRAVGLDHQDRHPDLRGLPHTVRANLAPAARQPNSTLVAQERTVPTPPAAPGALPPRTNAVIVSFTAIACWAPERPAPRAVEPERRHRDGETAQRGREAARPRAREGAPFGAGEAGADGADELQAAGFGFDAGQDGPQGVAAGAAGQPAADHEVGGAEGGLWASAFSGMHQTLETIQGRSLVTTKPPRPVAAPSTTRQTTCSARRRLRANPTEVTGNSLPPLTVTRLHQGHRSSLQRSTPGWSGGFHGEATPRSQ
nr:hypothetical protein [Streptomyces sp. 1331.2]